MVTAQTNSKLLYHLVRNREEGVKCFENIFKVGQKIFKIREGAKFFGMA